MVKSEVETRKEKRRGFLSRGMKRDLYIANGERKSFYWTYNSVLSYDKLSTAYGALRGLHDDQYLFIYEIIEILSDAYKFNFFQFVQRNGDARERNAYAKH